MMIAERSLRESIDSLKVFEIIDRLSYNTREEERTKVRYRLFLVFFLRTVFTVRFFLLYNIYMTPEKLFENKIKKELTRRNIWHVKFFANGMTVAGVPDILACVNGHFVALEIKSEKGKPSKLQLWQITEIRKSGGVAVIVYPKDYNTLLKLLGGLEKLNYTKY